jgi:hypothetical protein
MAKRLKEQILSKDAVALLRRKLSMMSITGLEDFYRGAYARCSLEKGSVPQPRFIQELVTAWREIRRNGPGSSFKP